MTLRSAFLALASVLASFLVMWLACVRLGIDPSPAVLSAALAVTLTRDAEAVTWRSLLRQFVGLPVVALGAGLVGFAFTQSLALGGALFSLCVALSIWLRRFGSAARALGRIIALPFVAMLVVPVRVHGGGIYALMAIAAGVVAVLCSSAARWMEQRSEALDEPIAPPVSPRERSTRIDPATRMAAQMFIALALAFALGGLLFPTHWFWVVLTAFIVCSGTVARGDAIYKGLLRFGGALGGTLLAALLSLLPEAPPSMRAVTIFVVLFFAMWLRERNYAYWAAGATLIFALLQGSSAAEPWMLFSLRVLGIVLGALCAIAATWFVMPIRTEQLLRKRVADLLAAHKRGDAVDHHLEALERAAAPMRLHRWIFRRLDDDEHPAALAERVARHVRSQKK